MRRLATVVQHYRQRTALTQQEAADLAGMSVASLRDVEQGRVVSPRPQTLRRLASALKLSTSETDELVRLARPGRPAACPVWISVLGPLTVVVDGAEVDPGSETQRALLALLTLSPNTAVSREELIGAAWGGHPPANVVDVLPSRISRLRRRLAPAAATTSEVPTLVASNGGYRLRASTASLDLLGFRQLVSQARRAHREGDLAAAADRFRQALGQWRGEPLAGLAPLADHPAVIGLIQLRHAVVVEYSGIASRLGRYEQVVPLLQQVVTADPLHERAHAQLMVALAGSGQQATALTLFESVRQRLAHELGADPGPELAEAHVRVLRQEVPRPEVAPVSAYRQLPPDIADFTGRDPELRWLFGQLPDPDEPAGARPVTICAIEGMGGVGKTRLAIHAAHQLLAAGRYADQQLYVDLHGHADEPPADPAAVLGSFLHLLGVPASQIPPDLSGRAALYRDRLHNRRALVLLDNAASEAQVRPLLPASPNCLVLITSRRTLAVDDARTLLLSVFTQPEAVTLLRRVVGAQRIDADPATAGQIADRCGRLPLAVALVARRLQARPAWTLADLAGRLADSRHRLGELAAGTRALRGVFDLSYQALPAASQHTFRLLGLHPGVDVTAGSVAALTGTDPDHARQTLDQLVDEHLVAAAPGSRYRLHDLLREYAVSLAAQDGEPACQHALERLLQWYVDAADRAQGWLFPEPGVRSAADPQPPHRASFTDDEAAFDWLAAEYANLLAAAATAAEHGFWRLAWQLPATLRHYVERVGSNDAWIRTSQAGLAAARRAGDQRGEVLLLNDLGVANGRAGRLDACLELLTSAVGASEALADPLLQARSLNNLGIALAMGGQLPAATERLEKALRLVRTLDEPAREARTLSNLARTCVWRGDFGEAISWLRSAIALQGDDPVGQAKSMCNLGEALRRDGQPDEAISVLQQARSLCRRKRVRADEAETLIALARALEDVGRHQQAADHWREALCALEELTDPYAEQVRAQLVAAGRSP